MGTFLLLFLGLSLAAGLRAQEKLDESLYVELFGNMGRYSLNGDVAFPCGVGFRIGVISGAQTVRRRGEDVREQTGFSFLVMFHALPGRGPHRLEGAVGVLAGSWVGLPGQPPFDQPVALTGTLGYRYQQPRGLIVRAGLTPAYARRRVYLMAGASIGYSLHALLR